MVLMMKANNPFKLFLFGVTIFFTTVASAQNSALVVHFQRQLKQLQYQSSLHYPVSVARFYKANGFHPIWVFDEANADQTFKAMMLLDCVLQYGLLHMDYHPTELTYDKLHAMIKDPAKIPDQQKAAYDIILTDAMITLINHLHFGKLNPVFNTKTLDNRINSSFQAGNILLQAIQSEDFTATVLSVQPQSPAYKAMQGYMRLVKGQYVGDCYEVPESNVRKVAINMERLRWKEQKGKNFIPKKLLYLTCSMKDGLPVFREDVYHQDQKLEAALYHYTTATPKKQPIDLPVIKLKKE